MVAPIADQTLDLVVVGGGIAGTMTASVASRAHPDWSVALVDRGQIGRGATQHSIALELGYARSAATRALVATSISAFAALAKRQPTNFRELGAVAVVKDTDEAMLNPGFESTARPPSAQALERLRDRWPSLELFPGERLVGGLWARRASPVALVEALGLELRRAAVQLWQGTEVTAIDDDGICVELEMSDGHRLRSRQAVLAIGPWITTGCWKPLADQLNVRVKKIVALYLEVSPSSGDPVLLLPDDDAFLLPDFENDRYIFSFASNEWDCPPDSGRLIISADDIRTASKILDERFPGLSDRYAGGRVFCDAYSRNRIPLAVAPAIAGGVHILTGGSGSGFRLAPGLAIDMVACLEASAPSTGSGRATG